MEEKKIPKNSDKKIFTDNVLKFPNSLKINSTDKRKPYVLPPLKTNVRKKLFFKPTSLLTKFIAKRAASILKESKNEISSNKNLLSYLSSSSIDKSIHSRNKLLEIHPYDIYETNNSTEKMPNLLLTTEKKNFTKDSSKEIKLMKNSFSTNNLFSNSLIKNKISNNQIPLTRLKYQIPKIKRICSYSPVEIDAKWEVKKGIKKDNKTKKYLYKKDRRIQKRIIQNEIIVIVGNFEDYSMNVIHSEDTHKVFETIPFFQKIEYNKMLEETISILLYLPKIFLMNFYKMTSTIDYIKTINKNRLKKKNVPNEKFQFKDNIQLISDAYTYFTRCFDFYLSLFNELNYNSDELILTKDDFNKTILYLSKLRYNITYLINSFENAKINYTEDINIINIISKKGNIAYKNNFGKKYRGKMEERDKSKKILMSLSSNNNEEDKKREENKKFKSVFNLNKIYNMLNYYNQTSKRKILDHILSNEIENEEKIESRYISKKLDV